MFKASDARPPRALLLRAGGVRQGFTLVELLVVIGVIGVLISLLLPALAGARRRARTVQCASNLRQVCIALLGYASENRGKLPPNIGTPSPGRYWYDSERAGRFLSGGVDFTSRRGAGGRGLTCPEDPDGRRSYAMNFWASCQVDPSLAAGAAGRGTFWQTPVQRSSDMILAAEKWSSVGSAADGWYATATIGFAGTTPGQRFGALGGITPPVMTGRWGPLNCELPYIRHRPQGGVSTAPVGSVNIGYADGHVSTKTERQLADFETGLSRLETLWSPLDPDINQ